MKTHITLHRLASYPGLMLGLLLLSPLAAQNVGIGIATPSNRLHVHAAAPADANDGQLRISESANNRYMLIGRAATYGFIQTHNNQPLALNPLGNNVGIGTATPTERLHVAGNLRLDGAFMPGNNAGTTGQVLRSQGAGIPPIWFPMAASIVYQGAFSSTANVCINNATWTTHPGTSITLPLQSGDFVWAWASGSAMADDNCDGTTSGWCSFDARIAVNGNDFPDGAWLRGSADWTGLNYSAFTPYTLVGVYQVPNSGNYTFALQTRRSSASGGCITAGDNTSALQTTLMILVLRP